LEEESEAQIPVKRAIVVDQCIWNKWAERQFVLCVEPKRHVPPGDFCRLTRTKKATDAGVIGVLNGPPWHY